MPDALEEKLMTVKLLETDEERLACMEIAKGLPEWFNEAGLRAIERDLVREETYLAAENGNVLGFITIKPINDNAMEILWMAVRREHQRKGIGSALLKFAESLARERGFEVLVVKTSGDFSYRPYDETRRFYEKKGFVRVALIDPYPEWGEEALIYVKCLTSSPL
ncbi:GNAT family N-acetyltransferase [Palaeococcus ferrophilus]|uniref:GNAT family N-acetyltransferase n=1 Tax=Palaeococcus ferrophilus TaxID=83868 RepID=UPI001FDFE5D4|nr:GNAT family N-acetyltransferase [Palaeococcus ferrophilus]